jgi:hypothetical protein
MASCKLQWELPTAQGNTNKGLENVTGEHVHALWRHVTIIYGEVWKTTHINNPQTQQQLQEIIRYALSAISRQALKKNTFQQYLYEKSNMFERWKG